MAVWCNNETIGSLTKLNENQTYLISRIKKNWGDWFKVLIWYDTYGKWTKKKRNLTLEKLHMQVNASINKYKKVQVSVDGGGKRTVKMARVYLRLVKGYSCN